MDGPCDAMRYVVIFQAPDVFGKLSLCFIPFVFEGHVVIVQPLLEGRFTHAEINSFVLFVAGNGSGVNDVGCEALAVEWACFIAGAVAGSFRSWLWVEDLAVVGFYYRFYIVHATVADFDVVSVENFMEGGGGGEVLVDEVEEFLGYFCLHVRAEWWVEPDYFSASFSC